MTIIRSSWKCSSYHCCTLAGGMTCSGLPKQSSSSKWHSFSPSTSLARSSFCGPSPSGMPICWVPSYLHTEKQGHSSSSSFTNHHNKRTCINSQEDDARSKHSSIQGGEGIHELILGTVTSFEQQGQELVRSLKSTGHQASSDSELSRENVDDSNLDTASGDYITCSDTNEVPVQIAHKKYRKRVWVSCGLSKGSLWMEMQLKRISDSHQDVWGHSHESVRTEWKHALVEDCNFFEMWKMTGRTHQLLCIAKATGSKIYTRDSEAKTHGRMKTLVLLLKQYHTHYYQFCEKGTTHVMVDLQGLHMNNAFWSSNVSASVGLKSFFPWCFKLGATWKQ